MTHKLNGKSSEIKPVMGAFDSFNKSLSELGSTYDSLRERIEKLDTQLSAKNQELEESFHEADRLRHLFDSIINSLIDGVIVINPKGRILLFNKSAAGLTGFSPDEVLGKSYAEIFGNRGTERFSPLYTIAHKRPLLLEEKELTTQEGTSIPVRYSTALVSDSSGDILGAVEVFRDLTRTKALEQYLRDIDSQNVLTEMANQLAHEIRNPLGGIKGYVDLIAESFEEEDPRNRMVDMICDSIKRLDTIVYNFNLFTKPVKPNMVEIDLLEMLEKIIILLIRRNKNKAAPLPVTLIKPEKHKAVQIVTDPVLLEHTLIALLDNALMAVRKKGAVSLSVTPECNSGLCRSRQIKILIEDSGEGMTQDILDQACNPFFTTREKGMGLGLTLARNYITLLRGNLNIESNPGKGTKVTIALDELRDSHE